MSKLSAQKIIEILKSKHWEDIFFSECKTGASYGSQGCPRMDGWVMKRSWAQQCFTAYEVKVDRSDFMNDDKWHTYLPYCNEFYFVCPTGLIKPDEVGPEAGLMYLSKTGTRLFRKKKAPHHPYDPEKLSSLLQYVMMWRMSLQMPDTCPKAGKKEWWIQWMKTKEINRDFGYSVGKTIRSTVKKEIENVRLKNVKLENLVLKCDSVRAFLKQYNINVDTTPTFSIQNQLREAYDAIPKKLIDSMETVESYLQACRQKLIELREKSSNDV